MKANARAACARAAVARGEPPKAIETDEAVEPVAQRLAGSDDEVEDVFLEPILDLYAEEQPRAG